MRAQTALILLFTISLLARTGAQDVCVLNAVTLSGLCIDLPLLGGLLCNLTSVLNFVLGPLGSCSSSLLRLDIGSGKQLSLNLDTDLVGLEINTASNSFLTLKLGSINITQDLILNGPGLISVLSSSVVGIGGVLRTTTSGALDIAGKLFVQGGAAIKGDLKFSGISSAGSSQTAWISSPKQINITGPESTLLTAPSLKMTGNGGIDAPVEVKGNVASGTTNTQSNVYIAKDLLVQTASLFRLAGNVTVEGTSNVLGRLHMNGARVGGTNQNAWFVPKNPVVFEGSSATDEVFISGNGGIHGDVILGKYAGMKAGNSPGVLYYNGNVQMDYYSYMEIEVAGSSGPNFDQYIVEKSLYRDGYLYITFLNGYSPGINNRFSFGSHAGATGTFHTVLTTSDYEVLAAYSDKSTSFVFRDPVAPAFCTCVSAN